jgi:hypothetical protein
MLPLNDRYVRLLYARLATSNLEVALPRDDVARQAWRIGRHNCQSRQTARTMYRVRGAPSPL